MVRILESQRPNNARKAPYLPAFSRVLSRKNARPHWLAGDAVLIAPVSATNSLQTGNFTGNLIKLAFAGRTTRRFLPHQRTLEPNSLRKEQGIFARDQGSSGAQQGCANPPRLAAPSFISRTHLRDQIRKTAAPALGQYSSGPVRIPVQSRLGACGANLPSELT
jgi:hypothetical protein